MLLLMFKSQTKTTKIRWSRKTKQPILILRLHSEINNHGNNYKKMRINKKKNSKPVPLLHDISLVNRSHTFSTIGTCIGKRKFSNTSRSFFCYQFNTLHNTIYNLQAAVISVIYATKIGVKSIFILKNSFLRSYKWSSQFQNPKGKHSPNALSIASYTQCHIVLHSSDFFKL